jgi:hypothetical protein
VYTELQNLNAPQSIPFHSIHLVVHPEIQALTSIQLPNLVKHGSIGILPA